MMSDKKLAEKEDGAIGWLRLGFQMKRRNF